MVLKVVILGGDTQGVSTDPVVEAFIRSLNMYVSSTDSMPGTGDITVNDQANILTLQGLTFQNGEGRQ